MDADVRVPAPTAVVTAWCASCVSHSNTAAGGFDRGDEGEGAARAQARGGAG